jgi:hypothetical protein
MDNIHQNQITKTNKITPQITHHATTINSTHKTLAITLKQHLKTDLPPCLPIKIMLIIPIKAVEAKNLPQRALPKELLKKAAQQLAQVED